MSNRLSTIIRIDKDEPYNVRAKLDTGTNCNQNCWFCYYKNCLDKKDSLETIKKRVDYLVECNIKEVDLSGGESSIHDDWFEILDYCKSKGLRVSTLSNGSMFCDMDFLRRSKEHGLEEILFSVHGYNDRTHDSMVGSKGAFKRIIRAIENANKLGMLVRFNCLVSEVNYRRLHIMYPKLTYKLKPYEVNFLTLNFWRDADGLKPFPYKKSTKAIKKCIDNMDVPIVNVRYTPFCYMVGYEKYVCNIYQHIYDLYDWNIAVYNEQVNPDEYNRNPLTVSYDIARSRRVKGYNKTTECQRCKYYFICDGIEKGLDDEVQPVHDALILDVNHYRKGYYEDKCSDTDS